MPSNGTPLAIDPLTLGASRSALWSSCRVIELPACGYTLSSHAAAVGCASQPGGGSGNNGGGGGGGSSYADISALVTAKQNTAGSTVEQGTDVRTSAVGDSWVELEWPRRDESDRGQEAVWYQVSSSRACRLI